MYDLDDIIYYYDSSINYLEKHRGDLGIKDAIIRRRVATLNYLKELKELKEKLDNPPTQVIVADEFNLSTDLDRYLSPKPSYTNRCGYKSKYDREKGILYAALKKLATKKEYNNILRTIDKGRTNDEWI